MGSRHWGDISPGDVEVSENAPDHLGPWPAFPFTDPPSGEDGQYVTGHFAQREWFCMWGVPWASAEEQHEVMGKDDTLTAGTNKVWVQFHDSLADASRYVAGATTTYVSLWRLQPPPKLAAALRRRKPWGELSERTLQGYRGRLRHQAHIKDPAQQAAWHRWAPDVRWLRRHGPYPREYLWATLWPQ